MNDDVLERGMVMSRSLHLTEVEEQLVPVRQRTGYPFPVERCDPSILDSSIIIIKKENEKHSASALSPIASIHPIEDRKRAAPSLLSQSDLPWPVPGNVQVGGKTPLQHLPFAASTSRPPRRTYSGHGRNDLVVDAYGL
jgi:hypothetical protein